MKTPGKDLLEVLRPHQIPDFFGGQAVHYAPREEKTIGGEQGGDEVGLTDSKANDSCSSAKPGSAKSKKANSDSAKSDSATAHREKQASGESVADDDAKVQSTSGEHIEGGGESAIASNGVAESASGDGRSINQKETELSSSHGNPVILEAPLGAGRRGQAGGNPPQFFAMRR
jgi:hypothetical protein